MEKEKDEVISISLSGRIDSSNASVWQTDIMEQITGKEEVPVILDASDLTFISSAGLRVILRLVKKNLDLKITNVHPDVYDIFRVTGFTELANIHKALRQISIEGCEEIGRGSNGAVYRIGDDCVVKVFFHETDTKAIERERDIAQMAMILGVPTAIPYDVVKVGNQYGAVFELLNARSFSDILKTEPDKMDWCVKEYAGLIKKIHSTHVPNGKLPDYLVTCHETVEFLRPYLPEAAHRKLEMLTNAIPYQDTMLHGDYHTRNVLLQEDEVILIDMDTLSVGHPVFELATMFNSFVGFLEFSPESAEQFLGINAELAGEFWKRTMAEYLETDDPERIREVEDKARIIGYMRMIRRTIRRFGLEDDEKRREVDHWKAELIALLERTDSLLFDEPRDGTACF